MNNNWTASESRLVEPYLRADELLAGVLFRCSPTMEFSDDKAYWFDRGELPSDFQPSFLLDIDAEILSEFVDIPVNELSVTMVVRDRARKRWNVVASWPLSNVPEQANILVKPTDYALAFFLEFVLLVTPSKKLPERPGRAYRTDQIVASTSFQIRMRKDGTRFNVGVVSQEWFSENGYPEDSVWAINWLSPDPYIEPAAALTVVINERYESAIRSRLEGEDGKVAAIQMGVDILLEASIVAISSAESYESEPTTLLGSVVSLIGIEDQEELDRIKGQMREDLGDHFAIAFLRSRIQSSLGLGRAMTARLRGGAQ